MSIKYKFSILVLMILSLCAITIIAIAGNPSAIQKDSLLLYPYPKVLQKVPGEVSLHGPLTILVSKNEESLVGVKVLRTELYKRFRAASNLQIVKRFDPSAENVIMIMLNKKGELDRLLKEMQINLPDKDLEGTFVLSARENRVVISAREPAGILYGVYDLLQLGEFQNDVLRIPVLNIEDWPTLKMRGYMFESSQSLGVQKLEYYYTLLDRLAQARINTVFPNVADGTWFCMDIPGRSELSRPRSFRGQSVTNFHPFTEQQLRDLTSYGAERGIEFVPMIQSIGHARLYTDIYPDLADPGSVIEAESSLDPFHPGIEYLLDDIYGFCAKIYSSLWMHVAGDEVYRFGNSEGTRQSYEKAGGEATGFTIYEWAYKHQIETIDRILKKYGKKQIIKTDVLLKHPKIADFMSKDIIIDVNNHYGPQVNQRSAEFFVNKGFDVIGCPAIIGSHSLVMPSTANIANVTQWTKIIQDLSLIGSRLCLWEPERVIDDACWLSIAYSGALFWEGTPEAKEVGTFDNERFFNVYTKFNFGLHHSTQIPEDFQVIQNNGPNRQIFYTLLLTDTNEFLKAIRGKLKDRVIENYAKRVNDPTGRQTIRVSASTTEYINKVNDELPSVIKRLQQNRKMVKSNLQEYDGLLLAARIEQFLGKVGKLFIEEIDWPFNDETKKAVREIAVENDQLLKDIIKARDHWRYEDNPARAGKQQGWERRTWLLHYFYDFQKMLRDSRVEYAIDNK